jgi:hypothetical protein
MEVKGVPVLRYGGQNYAGAVADSGTDSYGEYTRYVYNLNGATVKRQDSNLVDKPSKGIVGKSGQVVDLTSITVKVYKATSATKGRVVFDVPEEVLPVYYPELYDSFYYEELPVRLIYRVGLTQAETDSISNSKSAVERDYYVSDYSASSASSAAATTVTFTPAVSSDGLYNSYYFDEDGNVVNTAGSTILKAAGANASKTAAYVLSESTSAATGQVTQLLGNNGVLHVTRQPVITLEKVWPNGESASEQAVTVDVYRVTQAASGSTATSASVVTQLDPVSITKSSTGKWIATFEAPTEGSNGEIYKYYIAEQAVDGYVSKYFELVDGQASQEISATQLPGIVGDVYEVDGEAQIDNYAAYTLPSSGGVGEGAPVAVGCVLSLCSLAALALLRRRSHAKLGQ